MGNEDGVLSAPGSRNTKETTGTFPEYDKHGNPRKPEEVPDRVGSAIAEAEQREKSKGRPINRTAREWATSELREVTAMAIKAFRSDTFEEADAESILAQVPEQLRGQAREIIKSVEGSQSRIQADRLVHEHAEKFGRSAPAGFQVPDDGSPSTEDIVAGIPR